MTYCHKHKPKNRKTTIGNIGWLVKDSGLDVSRVTGNAILLKMWTFCINICSFFDACCVCARSLYLYIVDECMCAQVRVPVAPVTCSITLSLIPLRVDYSLNLELGWQSSYNVSSTVPSPLHTVATVWPHLASDMYGKRSYARSPLPSCLGILMKLSGQFFVNLL